MQRRRFSQILASSLAAPALLGTTLAQSQPQPRVLLRAGDQKGGLQAVEIFAAVGAGEHNDFRGRFGYNAFRRPLGVCLQFIRE